MPREWNPRCKYVSRFLVERWFMREFRLRHLPRKIPSFLRRFTLTCRGKIERKSFMMARNKFSAECEEEFHDDLIRLQTNDIEPLSLTTHRTSSMTVKRKLFKFVVVSWIYCMSPAAYHRSRISRSLKSITNWFTALHFLPTTRQVRPPNKVDIYF